MQFNDSDITSYRHGVISDLIDPSLLKDVRREIQDNLSFTPKETDIYKIHQSGDLANLDGLDDTSLKLLPSLKKLRNALYSQEFRQYLCDVTGSPTVSGQKTDMAINVYTPGCHLLCHDDVIGSRRISYILYLTDPDIPWKAEWGGALRLYPTEEFTTSDGQASLAPEPNHSKSISPAFNQLSFFAVLPGQSFHDVEEVYASEKGGDDPARVRMAISGWYHIPQEGEEGYLETDEAFDAKLSTLSQLQSLNRENDRPPSQTSQYSSTLPNGNNKDAEAQDELELSEPDFDFLLKYIAPTYLTPDALLEVADTFGDECSIILEHFLSEKFAAKLRDFIKPGEDSEGSSLPEWEVAKPPHKHRYLYQSKHEDASEATTPVQDLVKNLFPSQAFRKWFHAATGQTLRSHDVIARRFRKGRDYTLAQTYEIDEPRIEICLSITPSPGWEGNGVAEEAEDKNDKGKGVEEVVDVDIGGYLAYMAGDDDHDDDNNGSDHGVEVPADMSTGGRATRAKKQKTSDPAVYQAHGDDDDGVLFSMPACWNRLGIVLRDKGTMRFVKYVSQAAKGDRWDVFGEFEIEEEEGESSGEESGNDGKPELQDDEDEDEGNDNASEATTESDV